MKRRVHKVSNEYGRDLQLTLLKLDEIPDGLAGRPPRSTRSSDDIGLTAIDGKRMVSWKFHLYGSFHKWFPWIENDFADDVHIIISEYLSISWENSEDQGSHIELVIRPYGISCFCFCRKCEHDENKILNTREYTRKIDWKIDFIIMEAIFIWLSQYSESLIGMINDIFITRIVIISFCRNEILMHFWLVSFERRDCRDWSAGQIERKCGRSIELIVFFSQIEIQTIVIKLHLRRISAISWCLDWRCTRSQCLAMANFRTLLSNKPFKWNCIKVWWWRNRVCSICSRHLTKLRQSQTSQITYADKSHVKTIFNDCAMLSAMLTGTFIARC